MSDKVYYQAVGRRKEAIAQVRLQSGGGAVIINGKPLEEAFPVERLRRTILEPLAVAEKLDKFSVTVKVTGGGCTGQAGAIRQGLARAIVVYDANLKKLLKTHGLLTRDARVKERKKYGLVRARKAKQYTKR